MDLNQIITIISGSGSALVTLVGMISGIAWKSIKGKRYQRVKEGLRKIEMETVEKNPEEKEIIKDKLIEIVKSL